MKRIMVVDAESHIRDEIKVLVNEVGGFQIVAEFSDALSAMKQFDQAKPEIVISEVQLPGMSGIELAHWLKEFHPEVSLVHMSENSAYAVKGYDLGVKGFLLKPLGASKLTGVLTRLSGREMTS